MILENKLNIHFVIKYFLYIANKWTFECYQENTLYSLGVMHKQTCTDLKPIQYFTKTSRNDTIWQNDLTVFICTTAQFNLLSFYFSAGDLDNADYIAIAVSVGLTAFIVLVMGYLLWRARNRSAMGTNNIMGQVSTGVYLINLTRYLES